MQRLMIDIETTDTLTTARIISLAAVLFDDEKSFLTYTAHFDPDDQPNATDNERTLSLWGTDWKEANVINRSQPPIPSRAALLALRLWIDENANEQGLEVWANSPSFDCVIINRLARDLGLGDNFLPYKSFRDLRTLIAIATLLNVDVTTETKEIPKPAIDHVAVFDAVYQAKITARLLSRINALRVVY